MGVIAEFKLTSEIDRLTALLAEGAETLQRMTDLAANGLRSTSEDPGFDVESDTTIVRARAMVKRMRGG